MTFEVPKNASPIPLMQPEAPFLMAMRAFESLQEFQMEWWRAWSGLMGQVVPPEAAAKAEEIVTASQPDEATAPEQPKADSSETA
ncbi:hypothetical protein [Novosphingobium beihaiensis]|uniref:Uncharacterized protein n=1 Tax=Novosphingobium beihaiensis TaxID=2930389 RepID=A0ABT0BKV5_9SPHN|nr:hypothetical protein [Novosphingobium beihaiensis]MCJ2185691.1 hypothetical protein [Novosphingobium beihaiensis]